MTVSPKRIVVIGATSVIAVHCMYQWAKEGAAFTLVGRDQHKLEQIAAEIRIRYPRVTTRVIVSSFLDPIAIQQLADQLAVEGPIDIALIAQGVLPAQVDCERDLRTCYETLAVNAISPVLFAESMVGHMQRANHGCLAIIGSVAGDRGRKSNYVYGAAKGLLERYVQGLQHRLSKTSVKVILIKPGPTDTPMTAHPAYRTRVKKMATPKVVAQQIVKGIEKKKAVIYTPKRWAVIMAVVKCLPRFVFNRMDI